MKLSVIFCLMLITTFTAMLFSVTHIVDIDGTEQYTTIQTGIDASADGDTVLVYPGRYIENVTIQTNNISLISMEYYTNNSAYIDSTIIDGNAVQSCIKLYSNIQNIYIRGFSLTNARKNGGGGGIALAPNTLSNIVNCNIYNNTALYGGGINLSNGQTTLSGVSIHDNRSIDMGGGIYVNEYTGLASITFDTINRCSMYNNIAGAGQDIYLHYYDHELSVVMDTFSISNPTNYYVQKANYDGIDYPVYYNILQAHHQEVNQDLYVSPTGNDSNDGLTIQSPLKTINTAVYRIAADSLNQKTVHLLAGTYTYTDNQQIFPIALKNWVKVEGSGMDNTVVSGEQLSYYNNEQLRVFWSNYQSHVGLANLSITTVDSYNASAIYGYKEDYLHFQNIHIYGIIPETASLIDINVSTNSLWDNIIIGNIISPSYSLIRCAGYFQGVIKNSTFKNCTSTYVTPVSWSYPLIWMSVKDDITIENCVFDHLTMSDDDTDAIGIGGIENPSTSTHFKFINSQFTNITSQNEVISIGASNHPVFDVINCTFAGCNGNVYTLQVNGDVNITNSIFRNNTPHEIKLYSDSEHTNLTVDYSSIQNGLSSIMPGSGNTINYLPTNIATNPLFLGGDDTDPLRYSLASGSPCINAGAPDTTGLFLPIADLAGNYRVWDGRIDMGCYEYGSEPYVPNDNPENPPLPDRIALSTYPNPVYLSGSRGTYTFIEFTLPEQPQENPVIEIFNIKGQKIKSIKLTESHSSLIRKAGLSWQIKQNGEFYSTVWNCRNEQNQAIGSGLYIIKVTSGSQQAITKMMVIK